MRSKEMRKIKRASRRYLKRSAGTGFKKAAHATKGYLRSNRGRAAIMKRPQFSKHPIPRKKEIKKFHHTSPPIEVDATWDVALALVCPIPIGLLTGFGLGSSTARAISYMGTSALKTVKERAEQARAAEAAEKPRKEPQADEEKE